jgi:anhydro-N-acetylmuramic acid kinase
MSGTSQDAIDAVLAQFPPNGAPRILGTCSEALTDGLRRRLDALQRPGGGDLDEALRLHQELGERFAGCALELMRSCKVDRRAVRAIGSHGQTVRHDPAGRSPHSLQTGNAALIAARTGIPTVTDFRSGDIAAGGQGAPLAPAFHRAVLAARGIRRAILNLGGMANVTLLESTTRGWDTGPGNVLLDAWVERHLRQPYDRHGQLAQSGAVDHALLGALLTHPFIARPAPKSTGREDFNLQWLDQVLGSFPGRSVADVQATLAEFTAACVQQALADSAPFDELLLCGGGVNNTDLVGRIARRLPGITVDTTQRAGIDPQWIEALAFAWLAQQRIEERALDLRTITGSARPVVLGCLYLP